MWLENAEIEMIFQAGSSQSGGQSIAEDQFIKGGEVDRSMP